MRFNKSCSKSRHIFRIANGGARRWYPRRDVTTEYVDITEIQYYSNRWRTLNLPTAVWKQNVAEWNMTNLYASIVNTWHQIKASFILKNSSAYTRLRFAVTFTGLTYNATTGALTSTTDDTMAGLINTPTAIDANGAAVPVMATYASGYIEWSVDTTGATFPIDVDPTFTDGYGGDATTYYDTFIRSTEATTNKGTETTLAIGESNVDAGRVDRALVEFDLSSLSQTATVNSATLSLWLKAAGNFRSSNNRTIRVYRQRRAWVEAQATWNIYSTGNNWATAGGFGADDCEQTDIGSHTLTTSDAADSEQQFTLSGATVGDLDLGNGYLLRADTETDDLYLFYSSDDAATSYRPKLVIDYTAAASGVSIVPVVMYHLRQRRTV